jgi:N-acetylmuramoyl-L-alanine amidase
MLLRVVGVLIAATLACAVAHTTRADPRPADACKRAAFRSLIDVGHTAQAPGATSARGLPEFSFNLNLAKRIEQQLLAVGFRRSVLLITEGPSRKALAERVKRANALGADLFLSIHHDSVPDTWKIGSSRASSALSATASMAIPFHLQRQQQPCRQSAVCPITRH